MRGLGQNDGQTKPSDTKFVRESYCQKIKRGSAVDGKEAGRISEREGKRDTKETGDSEEIGNGGGRETEEEGAQRC